MPFQPLPHKMEVEYIKGYYGQSSSSQYKKNHLGKILSIQTHFLDTLNETSDISSLHKLKRYTGYPTQLWYDSVEQSPASTLSQFQNRAEKAAKPPRIITVS